ncbi:CzcE family metal-binding protein [Glaciimonas immobilis]|uniref:CzcE family metal-binding protein n=1 Tax=Glaciimonas immobilis TaxID=728004 RepID=A0A840RWT6_9BURK|nr:CzcE family metal-binding protein [Glaciimonas immobilis]KAF3996506.1 CzcE family metal-binding protein [Glaciimonas immobilis]MBB5201134.1 hypothetical protein [Glaciimonas immobilis]
MSQFKTPGVTATNLRGALIASTFALVCASAVAGPIPLSFLGDPGLANGATQTINIQPGTKYVNVTSGQTIHFVSGEKSFTWTFDVGSNVYSFDLNRVAPANALSQPVTVYVAKDPTTI